MTRVQLGLPVLFLLVLFFVGSTGAQQTSPRQSTTPAIAGSMPAKPVVSNVLARLIDGPKGQKGLSIVPKGDGLSVFKLSYRLEGNGLPLDVYVSRDPREFALAPTNLRCAAAAALTGIDAYISKAEYAVLQGKPSYLISRSDGLWFLFVCPDYVFDLCGFFKKFLENYAFFESRLPASGLGELAPAVVGTYS